MALAANYKNLAKINEKLHVFLDIDFGSISDGFWDGFGRPTSLIFAFLSMFFPESIYLPFAWVQWAQFRAGLATKIVQEGVLESYPPEWFNRDECFKQAMQTALNVKIALAKMTPGEIVLDDCKVRWAQRHSYEV